MDDLGRLLKDAGRGDREAFEEIVRDQLGRLYGIALRLTGDGAGAEDIVQDVFLRVWKGKVPRGTGTSAFSWLTRLAARRSIDAIREMAARRRREEGYAMTRESESRKRGADDPVSRAEEVEALASSLSMLPALTRACVWLHHAEGFGLREVAACVGLKKSSTAERIRTGLEKLRRDLGKRGFALAAAPVTELFRDLPRPAVPDGLGAKVRALPTAAAPVGSGSGGPLKWILGVGVAAMKVKALALAALALVFLSLAGWGIAWKLSRPAVPQGGAVPALVEAPSGPSPAEKPPRPPAAPPAGEAGRAKAGSAPPREGALRGRVLDLGEKPIAGARVTATRPHGKGDPVEVIAAEDGSFEFAGLAPGEQIVNAEDWCHFMFPSATVMIPTDEEVVLSLKPAAGLAVTFLVEGRGPLREERVEAYSLREGHEGGSPRVGMTDAEGRLYLGPFLTTQELGDCRFAFQAGNFAPQIAGASIFKESRSELEVVLTPAGGVTAAGTLRNLQGQPIPGMEILWSGPEGSPAVRLGCKTDYEGHFRRTGLSPGANQATILARLLNPQGVKSQVVLGDSPEQEVPLTLDCISVVTFRVEDADGKPIPEAPVMMQGTFKSSTGRYTTSGGLRAKEDGTTSLTAVPRDMELELTLDDPKLGFGKLKVDLSTVEETVIMRVDPMLLIEGVVVDGAGDPVPGATITLTTPRPFIKYVHGACDAAGKFSIKAAPGPYRLEASGGRRGAGAIDVDVGGDAPSTPWRVVVAPKAILLVHITDPDGKPASNVEVRSESYGLNGSRHKILTDSDGWAAFSFGEEPMIITVSPDFRKKYRQVPQFRDVRRGSPPIEVHLQNDTPRSISGVVFLDGQPVANAKVAYWGPNSGQVITPEGQELCDGAGKFHLGAPSGDDVYVHAWGPGFAMAISPVIHLPQEGDVDGVVVEALSGPDLQATVLDWEGKPAPMVTIYFIAEGIPPFQTRGKTDAEGVLRIPRVPPGTYRFFGGPGGSQVADREFQWTGAEELTFKLQKPFPRR